MKKLILFLTIAFLHSVPLSAQMGGFGGDNEPFILEEDPFGKSPLYNNEPIPIHKPANLKEFYTGGVTLGAGIGWGCAFDISIYVMNGLKQIISFGYSASLRTTSEKFDHDRLYTQKVSMWQSGAFIGYGQLYNVHGKENLSLGYLINVHGGYSSNGALIEHGFVGIEPGFILNAERFFFKLSVYADTSIIISGKVGLGVMY